MPSGVRTIEGALGKLTIKLFGPPQVCHEGRSVEFRARKSLALLAYLAAGGGPRSRDEITTLRWPRSDGERGRASLRSALAGLRGALGEAAAPPGRGHLVVDGDALGLVSGPDLDLDLDALEAAHALARSVPGSRDLAGGLHHETVSRLRSAAEAYRGEFLKGFHLNDAPDFDLWLDLQRGAWRGRLELVYDRLSLNPAVRPVIDREFRFEELPDALRHLKGGAHFGKVVLAS